MGVITYPFLIPATLSKMNLLVFYSYTQNNLQNLDYDIINTN